MCLYPTRIENPRYKKSNSAHPAIKYVTAKCGKCIECRQARAREWQQRLYEECLGTKKPHSFITFTVEDSIATEFGIDYENMNSEAEPLELYQRENDMIKKLVQRWRLRCNKKGLKQRHFFITEHGETRTKRIHIHGIIWADDLNEVAKQWIWGIADVGQMRDSTIPYIVKYMYKEQTGHPDYKSIVLATPGIGKSYIERNKEYNRWKGADKTNFTYILPSGRKIALCDYYMKKIYKRYQLEARRINMAEKGKRWVRGIEYNTWDLKSYREMTQKLRYEQKKHPQKVAISKNCF